MKKLGIYLIIVLMSTLLFACEAEQSETKETENALFKANEMDAIQLTGQEILDGEEAKMTVSISDGVALDFLISRDQPNGTKLYVIYKDQAINLAVNYISPQVFENDEAIPSYQYQMGCLDFNQDGVKEVVVACGNGKEELALFVFEVNVDSEELLLPVNYILGYDQAFTNEANDICVPSPNGVRFYKYNVKAQDAEYARKSGPVKVTLKYAEEEELSKFKTLNTFEIDLEGTPLLLSPTEKLSNFSVVLIEYDEATDKYVPTTVVYECPEISPEAPVLIKFFLPDFPAIGFTYYDENGVGQTFGIGESLKDGSLFLFQLDVEAKG